MTAPHIVAAARGSADDPLLDPAGEEGRSVAVALLGQGVRLGFIPDRHDPTSRFWSHTGAVDVLDVGSGGGIDTILAARRVGPEGRVVGLDVLEEMCERGRGHAAQAGVEGWTRFLQGEMEDTPLPDESVDVAISNGVLNLSARKAGPWPRSSGCYGPEGKCAWRI